MRYRKWLIVAALFLATFSGVVFVSGRSKADANASQWTPAARIVPRPLIQQVQSDLSKGGGPPVSVDVSRFRAIHVTGNQRSIYVFDPRIGYSVPNRQTFHEPFCGNRGCSYLIYASNSAGRYQQVFMGLRPPLIESVAATSTISFGLPCLELREDVAARDFDRPDATSHDLGKFTICFDGTQYQW